MSDLGAGRSTRGLEHDLRIALTRRRLQPLGHEYHEHRLQGRDTPREAIPALERRLSDEVFKRLLQDARAADPPLPSTATRVCGRSRKSPPAVTTKPSPPTRGDAGRRTPLSGEEWSGSCQVTPAG